jgi:hypothetical protein
MLHPMSRGVRDIDHPVSYLSREMATPQQEEGATDGIGTIDESVEDGESTHSLQSRLWFTLFIHQRVAD